MLKVVGVTRRDYTRRDYTRRNYIRFDYTRRDYTRRDYTRRDYTRRDYTRRDYTRRDTLMYARRALWAVRLRAERKKEILTCVVFVNTVPSCKIKLFILEHWVDLKYFPISYT